MHPSQLIQIDAAALAQIQALEKEAVSAVTQNNTRFLVGGIAVFGALVSPLGMPAAAMVASPLVLIAIKRAMQSGSAAAYLRESGNFAPMLGDRQLLKLTNLVGKDTVLAQLQEALEDGKWLSGSALDYLEHCGIDTAPPDLKAELAKLDKQQADQAAAIDVAATTVTDSAQPTAMTTLLDEGSPSPQAAVEGGMALIDLMQAIALDPKSLLISAPTRVGKGGLAAGAIRATQRLVREGKHPTIKSIRFWWLTPKQFRHEDWYWETCDQFHNPDLDAPDRLATVRSVYQFLVAYGELPRDPENPTVLGLDEFSRLMTLTAGIKMCQIDPVLFAGDNRGFDVWLVDRAIHSASMLQASGFYVWVIIPANTVGGKGFSKGDADSFSVITLASPLNMAFADGSSAAFAAPEISADHPVFQRGFAAGYRKRDRLWYAVPDFGAVISRRTAAEPVELKNRWLSPLPVDDSLMAESLEPVAETPVAPKPNPSKPLNDYFELFRYRPLLIWGPQGSGKSTIARQIVRLKQQQGQSVYVLNPHGSSVEWDGAPVVGVGRDYKAINAFLQAYLDEITERYATFAQSGLTEQAFLEQLVATAKVFSPICEEMSGWFHNLDKDLLGAFALAALSESRKVAMAPVFIAHDRALDFIGLKRGANLRDSGLVELELLPPETHPETGLLISSGRGILRIPGGAAFNVHFENFDQAATATEPVPQPFQMPIAPSEAPAALGDENSLMIAEYLNLQPECPTYSSVIERLGTKLERRKLIERRTVECLKLWLKANNLPAPGSEATPSEPATEPEPIAPLRPCGEVA